MSYPVEYQSEHLSIFREREKFSFLPIILVSDRFVWTGKWFKKIKVLEEKIKTRYLEFDDGWSYRHYWGPWKENYEFVKIIDKN